MTLRDYTAEELKYMATHRCRHSHTYLEHPSCFNKEVKNHLGKEVIQMVKYVKDEMREVVAEKSWSALEENKHIHIDLSPFYGKVVKFGFISDTHLGSKSQQYQQLLTAYKVFNKEKVAFVVHCGDLSEGNGNHYAGQIQELFLYTFDDQVRYIVSSLPTLKNGGKTYFITGDHDLDWFKQGGRDIGEAVAEQRPDWVYCGQSGAYITTNGGKKFIYLHHPRGGAAYAKSYKAQKWVESVAPENKPQIYLSGHFHSVLGYWVSRNVHIAYTGCLQSQTHFLVSQGVEVINAFCVITVHLDTKGSITRFLPDYHIFYIPKINDYPHFEFQKVRPSNEVNLNL